MLADIRQRLADAQHGGGATRIINESKQALRDLLRKRFTDVESQALTLKILNLLLADYNFRARTTAVSSRPFGLVVDPSNVCQLACPGCVHSQSVEDRGTFSWPKGTLTESRFDALLRIYGPTAIGVYFCDYGEPLLNLSTPRLIQMAKSYLASTALSTSMSVRRFDAEAYVRSGLDVMIISIDGATQQVYERFRRNGDLETVFKNVASLVEAKQRLGSRTPVLSWNFLAFEHNAHEIPAAENMARTLGVNVFRVVNPFDVSWDREEIRPADVNGYVKRLDWTSAANASENWNPFPHLVDTSVIRAAFANGFSTPAAGSAAASAGHTCHWLYKNMVMDATGRILPCCGAPGADGKLVFGSFQSDSAGQGSGLVNISVDPFNSARYQQARAFFTGGSGADVHCSKCDWDHSAINIGAPEIRRYFRAADPWFFDGRSLDLLVST